MTIFNSLGDRELLSKQVSSGIEEAILNKLILPGGKLPSEFELCSQFGVSRTVVREALRILSAKGLISIQKGRGIFVKNLSPDHVMDSMHNYLEMKSNDNDSHMIEVIQARIIIEPAIAEYAAAHRSDDDLKALHENISTMKKNTDMEIHARLDMEFHLRIAAASGNHIMPLILNPIHRAMPNIKSNIMKYVPGAKQAAVKWHQEIYNAIKAGDPKNAYLAMKEHLEVAKEHTEQMISALESSVKKNQSA